MDATQETELYRREGEQQARDRWNKKGAKLTPATCDRLAAAMAEWAEGRVNTSDPSVHQEGVGTSSDEAHGIKGAIT